MRKTCRLIEDNISYRWFLGLDIYDKVPDHSTYSKNMERKFIDHPEIYNEIFNKIIKEAYNEGFINPDNIFGDATHVKANANKKKHKAKVIKQITKTYKEDIINDINKDREEHNKKPIKNDEDDSDKFNGKEIKDSDELLKNEDSEEIIDSECDEKGKVISYDCVDVETGEIHKRAVSKGYKRIKESTTDKDSGFYHKGEHEKVFAYAASAACDNNGFIVALHVDKGNLHDSVTFFELNKEINKLEFSNNIKNIVLDAGYKTPAICREIIKEGKQALMPYTRPKTKKEYFKKYEFTYDEYYDNVICPNNETLEYSTTTKEGYKQYKSDPKKCISCPYKRKCTNSKNSVKVYTRHIWQNYLDETDEHRYEEESKKIYARRKKTIERCFGEGKENNGLRFTRYRGIKRVSSSLRLLFACQNLRKLARWKWKLA